MTTFTSSIPSISLLNHKELFEANARALGHVYTSRDLLYTSCGPDKHAMVVLLKDHVDDSQLNNMMDTYSSEMPKTIGVWRQSNTDTHEISSQLLSRGFQLGWEPQWMGLELDSVDMEEKEITGVKLRQIGTTENLIVPKEVPFSSEDDNSVYSPELRKDGRVVKFAAFAGDKVVGHTDVFFGSSPGLYNVGVDPEYTKKGIATELVKMACRYAKEKGFSNVTLNGTGTVVYERIGFVHASNGATWWLHREKYVKNTPTELTIIYLVCQGDLDALEQYCDSLGFSLANGMTLVEIALHFEDMDTAKWLVANNAPHSIVDLWDVGGVHKAMEGVALINKVLDEGKTALHIAVERGDEDFAKFLLNQGADRTVKDAIYGSTPEGWAKVLGRTEIEDMLKVQVCEYNLPTS